MTAPVTLTLGPKLDPLLLLFFVFACSLDLRIRWTPFKQILDLLLYPVIVLSEELSELGDLGPPRSSRPPGFLVSACWQGRPTVAEKDNSPIETGGFLSYTVADFSPIETGGFLSYRDWRISLLYNLADFSPIETGGFLSYRVVDFSPIGYSGGFLSYTVADFSPIETGGFLSYTVADFSPIQWRISLLYSGGFLSYTVADFSPIEVYTLHISPLCCMFLSYAIAKFLFIAIRFLFYRGGGFLSYANHTSLLRYSQVSPLRWRTSLLQLLISLMMPAKSLFPASIYLAEQRNS